MWQFILPVSGVVGVVLVLIFAGVSFHMGYVGDEQPNIEEEWCENDQPCAQGGPVVAYTDTTMQFLQNRVIEPWYEVGAVFGGELEA